MYTILDEDDTAVSSDILGNIDLSGKSWNFSSCFNTFGFGNPDDKKNCIINDSKTGIYIAQVETTVEIKTIPSSNFL